MPRKHITQGISMSPQMRDAVTARAARLGMTVSGYLQNLIRRDISQGGPIIVEETPAPYAKKPSPRPRPK